MSNGIRNAIQLIFAVVLVAVAGYIFYSKYEASRPCAQPVHYTLGSIDPRFGLANDAVLADAESAAGIWNKAWGKTLLTYDPKGNVPINFVYDDRQQLAQLGEQITREQAVITEDSNSIDALKAQYQSQLAAYNQAVTAANARGGATREEYAQFEAERSQLNALGAQINAEVDSYNAMVRSTNAEVSQYDASAGTSFKEGEYIQDAHGARINIYEFTDNTQLERVLAHELGHAIGLGHNTNPSSIMYAKNESGNLKPTADDLAALKQLCGA